MSSWPLTTRQALSMALLSVVIGVSVASASYAITSIGTDISTDGSLTANGNVNLNDASADTLLIGQNGGTPDTVTIAGDLSLADAHWSVSATGTAVFASLSGDGSGLTALDAGDLTTGSLNDARLSSSVAHLDAAETITSNWVNTANPWSDNEVADNLTISGGTASVTSLTVGASGGAAISRHLSTTASNVTSASIGAASCGDYATISVTNAAVGDTVIASPSPATNGIEDVNLSWSAYVSAADTVIIRACNPQPLSSIDTDNTQTWRVDVWQH